MAGAWNDPDVFPKIRHVDVEGGAEKLFDLEQKFS